VHASGDPIPLTEADDGKLFVVRVLNTGEERIARYHYRELAGQKLRFPRFADPNNPGDYRLWLHEGWGGRAVRRVQF
jgi:hypothetical protein